MFNVQLLVLLLQRYTHVSLALRTELRFGLHLCGTLSNHQASSPKGTSQLIATRPPLSIRSNLYGTQQHCVGSIIDGCLMGLNAERGLLGWVISSHP